MAKLIDYNNEVEDPKINFCSNRTCQSKQINILLL